MDQRFLELKKYLAKYKTGSPETPYKSKVDKKCRFKSERYKLMFANNGVMFKVFGNSHC